MSININDLNEGFETTSSSSLSNNRNLSDNLRELSLEELQISGGGSYYGVRRTVIVSDNDLDVYVIDSFPTNVIYNAEALEIMPGESIDFDNGSVAVRRNGNIDITFSASDYSF